MGTGAPAGVVNESARERLAGARRATRPADECAGDGLAGAGRATRVTDECAGGGLAWARGGNP